MKKVIGKSVLAAAVSLAVSVAAQAEGDPVKGEKVFRKCKACHSFDAGKRLMGPHLNGVVGRKIASIEGYRYSKVFQQSDLVWDEENLGKYLQAPRKFMKGTKMAFAGLRKPQDIADVLAYIKKNSE